MNPGGALPGVGVELCLVNRTLPGAACGFGGAKGRLEKCTLSDLGVWRANREKTQCFRVRADVFASAHGRPDGMPGRIIGARAKALPARKVGRIFGFGIWGTWRPGRNFELGRLDIASKCRLQFVCAVSIQTESVMTDLTMGTGFWRR